MCGKGGNRGGVGGGCKVGSQTNSFELNEKRQMLNFPILSGLPPKKKKNVHLARGKWKDKREFRSAPSPIKVGGYI